MRCQTSTSHYSLTHSNRQIKMKKVFIIASLLLSNQNVFAGTTTHSTLANQQEVARPHPVQTSSNQKSLSTIKIGSGTSWLRQPRVSIQEFELQDQSRKMVVKISADTSGQITHAIIEHSSGLAELDQKVLRAVRSAKLKPYIENGIAYPFVASQPFYFAYE